MLEDQARRQLAVIRGKRVDDLDMLLERAGRRLGQRVDRERRLAHVLDEPSDEGAEQPVREIGREQSMQVHVGLRRPQRVELRDRGTLILQDLPRARHGIERVLLRHAADRVRLHEPACLVELGDLGDVLVEPRQHERRPAGGRAALGDEPAARAARLDHAERLEAREGLPQHRARDLQLVDEDPLGRQAASDRVRPVRDAYAQGLGRGIGQRPPHGGSRFVGRLGRGHVSCRRRHAGRQASAMPNTARAGPSPIAW